MKCLDHDLSIMKLIIFKNQFTLAKKKLIKITGNWKMQVCWVQACELRVSNLQAK